MVGVNRSHERNLRLRAAMEREGLGPSVWRERDCVSFIRAAVGELSGREPSFALPAWTAGLGETEAVLRAPREHGSLRACWLAMLAGEPLLRRLPAGFLPAPGMIAMSAASAPLIGVIGADCALWTRSRSGLRRAGPIAALWEVV